MWHFYTNFSYSWYNFLFLFTLLVDQPLYEILLLFSFCLIALAMCLAVYLRFYNLAGSIWSVIWYLYHIMCLLHDTAHVGGFFYLMVFLFVYFISVVGIFFALYPFIKPWGSTDPLIIGMLFFGSFLLDGFTYTGLKPATAFVSHYFSEPLFNLVYYYGFGLVVTVFANLLLIALLILLFYLIFAFTPNDNLNIGSEQYYRKYYRLPQSKGDISSNKFLILFGVLIVLILFCMLLVYLYNLVDGF